jgi:hypothetical protein
MSIQSKYPVYLNVTPCLFVSNMTFWKNLALSYSGIPRIVTLKMTLETSGGSYLHKSTASHTVIHNSSCTGLWEPQMSKLEWLILWLCSCSCLATHQHAQRQHWNVNMMTHHTTIRTWAGRRFEQEKTMRVPWGCHSFITSASYHCVTCGGWQTFRLLDRYDS